MEVLQHSVEWNGQQVSVELEGFAKTDQYATNLNLTGMANWFGSRNVCDMLADHAADLFGDAESSVEGAGEYCFLELGSGLGRAGLMALKLMALQGRFRSRCVLTDGEEEIVKLLERNYTRNFPPAPHNTGVGHVPCSCQYLRWGPGLGLRTMQLEFSDGFDLILGCDLIYGPESPAALHALLLSVDLLLAVRGESSGGARARACRRAEEAAAEESGGEELGHGVASGADTGIAAEAEADTGMEAETNTGIEAEVEATTGAEAAEDEFSIEQRPAFYLAVTRRDLLPLDELRLLALRCGLRMRVLEDYTFDIFDTCVDADSMFWRDTILQFTRT
jgi:hypothetical protein